MRTALYRSRLDGRQMWSQEGAHGTAILATIGAAWTAGSPYLAMLITVRVLHGIGLGMLICLVPLYLSPDRNGSSSFSRCPGWHDCVSTSMSFNSPWAAGRVGCCNVLSRDSASVILVVVSHLSIYSPCKFTTDVANSMGFGAGYMA